MLRRSLLWASRNRWLAVHLPRYRFARAAVRRFMPGEELDAALAASAEFGGANITTVLTRLGENVTRIETADGVADHYRMVLDRIAERGIRAQISVKLTQLGLDISRQRATQHLTALAAYAANSGNVVWVDMEGSAYVQRTIDLFGEVLALHRNVGLCVQAYLHRTGQDLDQLLSETSAIRLVKGAYAEPPDVALQKRPEIDAAYEQLARRIMERVQQRPAIDTPPPALATHDVELATRIASAAAQNGVAKGQYEIQMLYGIRPADQRRLAAEGHAVRVLISYGPEWFAWFVRRLAEKPSNLGFVFRNLLPV